MINLRLKWLFLSNYDLCYNYRHHYIYIVFKYIFILYILFPKYLPGLLLILFLHFDWLIPILRFLKFQILRIYRKLFEYFHYYYFDIDLSAWKVHHIILEPSLDHNINLFSNYHSYLQYKNPSKFFFSTYFPLIISKFSSLPILNSNSPFNILFFINFIIF